MHFIESAEEVAHSTLVLYYPGCCVDVHQLAYLDVDPDNYGLVGLTSNLTSKAIFEFCLEVVSRP